MITDKQFLEFIKGSEERVNQAVRELKRLDKKLKEMGY